MQSSLRLVMLGAGGPRGPNSVMHLYKGFSLARLDPETLPCFLGFPLVMSGREDHFASQRQ